MNHDSGRFRKVLDLCDELNAIRERLTRRRPESPAAGRLLEKKLDKLVELSGELDEVFAGGGLGEIKERFTLSEEELVVTALLFSHRIRKGARGISGREILSILHESAYDMVRAMGLLAYGGNLRLSGVVVAAQGYREDVLETVFRLSDEVFYMLVDEIGQQLGGEGVAAGCLPFGSAREHLLEMGRLGALYRKRAAGLFPVEAQDFFHIDDSVTPDEIEYRIEAGWVEIEQRLLHTSGYEKYPLVRLERKHALSRNEMMVVTSLFFVEMISPAPYLVVGDLVKLVSRDEEDLMSARKLLQAASPLVASGIIVLDDKHGVHSKVTTYDAYLADWVVDELAGLERGASGITTDMQIDVHEFLNGLSEPGEGEKGPE